MIAVNELFDEIEIKFRAVKLYFHSIKQEK